MIAMREVLISYFVELTAPYLRDWMTELLRWVGLLTI